MNVSAEERIRRALADLREATPDISLPKHISEPHAAHGRRSWLAVAAATIIIAGGAAGIIVLQSTSSDAPGLDPAAAPPAATNAAEPALSAVEFLAPSRLPDGYVLYTDVSFGGTYTDPSAGWRPVEVLVGPANATPDDIVGIVAGATVGQIQCGSTDSGEGLDAPGIMVGEAMATFCSDPYADRQLTWSANGTPVMLLAGSAVDDDQLLTIARGVAVEEGVGLDRQIAAVDITVTALPDGWARLGSDSPLGATVYTIGSATDSFAPAYEVSIFAGTEPDDIWPIMNGNFTATEVTVRGTTGYLDNSDDHNPFLVWQEADGLIVHIQNRGGTPDSIRAFAESLAPIDADEQHTFLESAQQRPTPPETPTAGAASTTTT